MNASDARMKCRYRDIDITADMGLIFKSIEQECIHGYKDQIYYDIPKSFSRDRIKKIELRLESLGYTVRRIQGGASHFFSIDWELKTNKESKEK